MQRLRGINPDSKQTSKQPYKEHKEHERLLGSDWSEAMFVVPGLINALVLRSVLKLQYIATANVHTVVL